MVPALVFEAANIQNLKLDYGIISERKYCREIEVSQNEKIKKSLVLMVVPPILRSPKDHWFNQISRWE